MSNSKGQFAKFYVMVPKKMHALVQVNLTTANRSNQAAGTDFSLLYRSFKIMGVEMEDTRIRRITAVK